MNWVLILSFLSFVNAADFVEPTQITEDIQDSTFLNQTRLRCVSEGIRKATGETPSEKYLGTLAFIIRENVKFFDQDNHYDLRVENVSTHPEQMRIRLPYIVWMANYVSTYGYCTNQTMDSDTSRALREAISSSRFVSDKDEIAKKISGMSYDKLVKVFNPKTESGTFQGISSGTAQAAFASKNTEYGLNLPGLPRSEFSTQFKPCLNSLKTYQSASAGNPPMRMNICQAIISECGYNSAICSKYNSAAGSPQQRAPSSTKKK